jgi:hypothetical protein
MWTCPRCARTFAARNQTHNCRPLGDLEHHFAGKDPVVREIFDAVLGALPGPVEILPEKTRIALQVRMSFAAFVPRLHWLDGHVVLAELLAGKRFTKVETYSRHNVVHFFRLRTPAEVDEEVTDWLSRAYAVGRGDHRR